MRVIAGTHRGAPLEAPEGRATRPTSDRAREGLFNTLVHGRYRDRLIDGVVADLFAGCGAVGIEALSRGAARAVFVERAAPALRALEGNLDRLGLAARARVVAGDATRLPAAPEAASLVFLDPPYGAGESVPALARALAGGWLAPDGVAVVQQHPKEVFAPPAGLAVADERRYGAARFLILERAEAAA